LAKDLRTPIVNPPVSAKDAYPISGLTFLLVRKEGPEIAQQKAVKDFIAYVIGNGQDAADVLSYAKLPASLQQRDQTLLGELTAGGHALN
jgi:phosphate transport system substrate-binding protein